MHVHPASVRSDRRPDRGDRMLVCCSCDPLTSQPHHESRDAYGPCVQSGVAAVRIDSADRGPHMSSVKSLYPPTVPSSFVHPDRSPRPSERTTCSRRHTSRPSLDLALAGRRLRFRRRRLACLPLRAARRRRLHVLGDLLLTVGAPRRRLREVKEHERLDASIEPILNGALEQRASRGRGRREERKGRVHRQMVDCRGGHP